MEITLISRISLLIFYLNFIHFSFQTTWYQQECIPVGCVPPAAVAICRCGGGGLPQCMLVYPLGVGLETPRVWAWRPPWVWAWRPPPGPTPQYPPGCGPGDPPGQTPQHTPWVWAWRPPPPRGQTDMCKT